MRRTRDAVPSVPARRRASRARPARGRPRSRHRRWRSRRLLLGDVADRRSAHAGPGGAGLPRRPVPPARLRRVGRQLVRGAPPARATACCSRRSARWLGLRAVGRAVRAGLDGAVRGAGGRRVRPRARAGARSRSRSRRSATSGSGGWPSRSAWRSRSAPCSRCGAGIRLPLRLRWPRWRRRASPVAGLLLGLAARDRDDRGALAACRCSCWRLPGGGRRAAARDAVPGRRLRAVPDPLLRRDRRA